MFTINIYLKLALIFVGVVGGVACWVLWGFWYGFPLVLAGILLLVSYILLGTVQSAAQMMEKADIAGCQKRLGLVLNPKWLYATNRAYYYILKGSLAAQQKDNDEAEKYLKIAKNIKLPSDNERAMVQLQLANLAANKGQWNEAKMYHREIKKLKISEPTLKEQISQFDKAMTNRGQMKHMRGNQGGQMMSGKGKRRRPKMR